MSGGAARASRGGKFNSTSTLYVSSTISAPNNDEIIDGVARIVQCLIVQSLQESGTTPEKVRVDPRFAIFDERTYGEQRNVLDAMNSMSGASSARDERHRTTPMMDRLGPTRPIPDVGEIYQFLKSIFDLAKFSPECNTLSLILINRLLTFTAITFNQFNWRTLMLSSLLIAQKIWDDSCLANIDFPILWQIGCPTAKEKISVKTVNAMEGKYLELLQFNVYVSSALYARYYFELRTLLECQNPTAARMLRPMNRDEGERLEQQSASATKTFEKRAVAKARSFQDDYRSLSRKVLS